MINLVIVQKVVGDFSSWVNPFHVPLCGGVLLTTHMPSLVQKTLPRETEGAKLTLAHSSNLLLLNDRV